MSTSCHGIYCISVSAFISITFLKGQGAFGRFYWEIIVIIIIEYTESILGLGRMKGEIKKPHI